MFDLRYYVLMAILFQSGCGSERMENNPKKSDQLPAKEAIVANDDEQGSEDQPNSERAPGPLEPVLEDDDFALVPPAGIADFIGPQLPYPPYIPGGGGGARSAPLLPCEGNTSDCNDKNPCTVDSCDEMDQCVNVLDTSKQDFGSCEVDGSSCTAGKCVQVDATIFCHEQARDYILGEQGCADEDPCTADSCIELPLDQSLRKDADGNVILNNEYLCVQELMSGLTCFVEHDCLVGICEASGSGMPGDEFVLECIADAEAAPSAFCPDVDDNPCTIARCDVESGCVSENLADDTACDDLNPCTENESCQNGICMGEMIDCDDANTCTEDFCTIKGCTYVEFSGASGDSCTTLYPGICSSGFEICIDGELTDPVICEPTIFPGDRQEICGDEEGLDEDCDGQIDDLGCLCPEVSDVATIRYVDPSGDDSGGNDCTDENAPCQTIAYAVTQAISGDALFLSSGTFNEAGITVDKDLSIIGQSSSLTIVDGNDNDSVFIVQNSIAAIFCSLTITDGLSTSSNRGGGIRLGSGSEVKVINSVISESQASLGGGVGGFAQRLDVINSTIINNQALVENLGGGIYNIGLTNVVNSSISDNSATNGAGIFTGGPTNISNSIITSNMAVSIGGGIYAGGPLVVEDSFISENPAGNGGGGIYAANFTINNTVISQNTCGTASGGGGILSDSNDSLSTINNSTIDLNTSGADGGGISIDSGTLNVNNSTISNNAAISEDDGGGIYSNVATVNIENSTISGNFIDGSDGAGGEGAGIYSEQGSINLSNSTVTSNNASSTGGVYSTSGSINVNHSIIADQVGGVNCGGIVVDNGFNLESATECGFVNNGQQNANADLGPLQDNGGPTFTHALGDNSDAIDTGDTTCGVDIDQRGFFRPINIPGKGATDVPLCDIGAFEVQP